MADLFFCVFEAAGAVALGDPIQESKVSITGSSLQSAAIVGENRKRRRVRIHPDADCFVTWGANPEAQTDGSNGRPMPSGGTEYFDIEAGHKIAVIEKA